MKFFVITVCFFAFTLTISALAQIPLPTKTQGIESFQKGDFKSAITTLNNVAKTNQSDAEVFYYLGAAYLKENNLKDARKTFENAIKIKTDYAPPHTGLALIYLLKEDYDKAFDDTRLAIKLNPNDFEAHYILGILNYREASYNAAYNEAEKVIKINPNYANAYLLKSEALAQSYGILAGAVTKSPNARSDLLKEAGESLENYLKLVPNAPDAAVQRERMAGLKYMGEYYALRENQPNDTTPAANITPLKIIFKPRAEYTETARRRRASGTVRVSVLFGADGKIGYVIVFKSLEGGLTEQAIKAAHAIKFEPEKRDGQSVPVIKVIEYNFRIG